MNLLVFSAVIFFSTSAFAGIFNLPRFVPPGQFAIGLEPELVLSNGAGFGVNLKYTHGISDLSNVTGIIGTGDGPKKFRTGANITFDFFPDVDNQPGIGVAAQAMYCQLKLENRIELMALPYIHKTFVAAVGEFEPFFSLPFGMGFTDGKYKFLANVAIGTIFKGSEKLRYILEIGVAIQNTESYISAGIAYYH